MIPPAVAPVTVALLLHEITEDATFLIVKTLPTIPPT